MRAVRAALAVAVVGLTILIGAQPASAHVSIPDPGEKGGFSIVTFSVPNERDDAGTTSLVVQLPEDYPLAFVSVQPKPGWTSETTPRTLDEPIDVFGEEVTEVVDTVTWTGGEIGPGEFDTFSLSVGVLPDDVDGLAFPAIQTYSDGEEVAWIEATPEGGEEPEHPAPVLRLVDPPDGGETDGAEPTTTTTAAATDDDEVAAPESEDSEDEGSDGVAIAALVVGIVAALLAGAAFMTARRGTG